jgi:rod shape-determining protein MreD
MKWLFLLVSLIVCTLIQVQSPTWVLLGGMKCPLILACVLYYALVHDRPLFMASALVGGLLHDGMSATPLGYSSILFVCMGWVASLFRRRLVIEAAMTSIVLTMILNVLFTLGLWSILSLTTMIHITWFMVLLKLLGAAVLGAVTGPIVCAALGSLEHSLGNRERSSGYA